MASKAYLNKLRTLYLNKPITPVRLTMEHINKVKTIDLSKPILPLCIHTSKEEVCHSEPTEFQASRPSATSKESAEMDVEGWECDKEGLWVQISLPCERCKNAYPKYFNDRYAYYAMALTRQYLLLLVNSKQKMTGRKDAYNILEPVQEPYKEYLEDAKMQEHYKENMTDDEVRQVADMEEARQKDIVEAMKEYRVGGRLSHDSQSVPGWLDNAENNGCWAPDSEPSEYLGLSEPHSEASNYAGSQADSP